LLLLFSEAESLDRMGLLGASKNDIERIG